MATTSTTNEKRFNDFMMKVNDFIERLNSIISNAIGEDYQKYKTIYMKCSNGYSLALKDTEITKKSAVSLQNEDGIKITYFSADEDTFSFYHWHKKRIPSYADCRELSEEEYHTVSDFLESIPINDMVYDKNSTRGSFNMYKPYKLKILEETNLDLHLKSISLYPTIQKMVDYWGLVVASYFISRNEPFNSSLESKIEKFKTELCKFIEKQIYETGDTRVYIHLSMSFFNHLILSNAPIMMALKAVGINLEDFKKYIADERELLDIKYETKSDIDYTSLPYGSATIEELMQISPEVNKKMLFWCYKIIEAAHNNGIYDNRTVIARCLNAYNSVAPTIKKVLDSGKKITVDEQKLFDIMLTNDELSIAVDLLNEAIQNDFATPSNEIDVIDTSDKSSKRI